MAQGSEFTPLRREIIRMLLQDIATTDGTRRATICHHLPVPQPDGHPPAIFIIHLVPNPHGAFLAICRELPGFAAFGKDEQEALALAELAIQAALHRPPDHS